MNRTVVLTVGLTALVAGVSLASVDVRQEREFQRLILAGDEAVSRNDTVAAVEFFSGSIALKGDSMLAYLKRGDTYRRRGDLAAAARDLRQASTLDPTAPRPIELLADVYSAMGRQAEAIALYHEYIELDDRVPAVLYKLGLAYTNAGQPEKAIEALQRAIVLNERLPHAHYALGLIYRRQNRIDEALDSLNRALAVDATFPAARQELADMLAAIGRPAEGIDQLEALAALEPRRPERLVSVGLAFVHLRRYENAILTLDRALERHPGSSLVLTALGRAWLAMAESGTDVDMAAVRKAAGVLQEIAGRPDASAETLTLYGRALLMSDDVRGAERVLQQAVSRLPIEPVAFRDLADAASRLGHRAIAEDARARYARF